MVAEYRQGDGSTLGYTNQYNDADEIPNSAQYSQTDNHTAFPVYLVEFFFSIVTVLAESVRGNTDAKVTIS